ncbi:MAG: PHP domain-containing protein [Cellulosilyticaceae bacterium]
MMLTTDLIDLHVHSNRSDGTFSPEEVAHLAKEAGLRAIALTDHDTLEGVKACMETGASIGLEVIPGIELSGDFHGKEIHIIGYFIDSENMMLKDTLTGVLEERDARNLEMLHKLQALGFALEMQDLSQGPHKEIITRAHFARALREKGYIKDNNEAFDKYIGAGCPAYVPKASLSFIQCIDLIHQCGGVAVLAHPGIYKFCKGNMKELILELKAHCIDGVEVIYPKHAPETIAMLTKFCKEQDLAITGGSDFHGANKPETQIGKGLGVTAVPYHLIQKLRG